jgi:hypothetical protein
VPDFSITALSPSAAIFAHSARNSAEPIGAFLDQSEGPSCDGNSANAHADLGKS